MQILLLIFSVLAFSPHLYAQESINNNLLFYTDTDVAYSSDALNRLYIVGLQYLNEGELTQAEISFRSILAFPYRSEDWRTIRYYKGKAHFYLGDIYFIQQKYKKSSEHYQQVVQEFRNIEEYRSALFKLGRSLILDGQQLEGIDVLKNYNYSYAAQEGFVDNTLYWIANGYISLEEYTSALKILHQILRDFPQSPMAYDVRILISKLETDLQSNVDPKEEKLVTKAIEESKAKIEKIENEKELIIRMKQLLSLKEQLLLMKEKKLELLQKISILREEALEKNQLLIDANNTLFK